MSDTCRKREFPRRRDAMKVAKRIGGTLKPYRCSKCGWYHMTTARKKAPR